MNTKTYFTIEIPTVAEGENWADAAKAAWLNEFGGHDVTGCLPEGDPATWVGDVERAGHLLRLEADIKSGLIVAWTVTVTLSGIDMAGGFDDVATWSGRDWLTKQETPEEIIAGWEAEGYKDLDFSAESFDRFYVA